MYKSQIKTSQYKTKQKTPQANPKHLTLQFFETTSLKCKQQEAVHPTPQPTWDALDDVFLGKKQN